MATVSPLNNIGFKIGPKAIFKIIVALIIISILYDGFVSVPAGHAAVIYDRGRGVLEKSLLPGLHFKIPLWQEATIFDTRTQQYTMSIAQEDGNIQGDDSVESRTKDGQMIRVDATILFHVNADDTYKVFQNLGNLIDAETKIVRPQAREEIRTAVAKFNALDLVSEKRELFINGVNEQLQKSLVIHYITLEEISIRNIAFSDGFSAAIEEKQIAEQRVITASFRKQQAEQEKEQKIIEAQGEAESIKLKGEVLKQYPQVIQLEFVNKMASSINWGILPDGALPLIDLNSLNKQ